MNCQISILYEAGKNLTFKEFVILRVQKKLKHAQQAIKKIFFDPHIIIRKAKSLFGFEAGSSLKKARIKQKYPEGSPILSLLTFA